MEKKTFIVRQTSDWLLGTSGIDFGDFIRESLTEKFEREIPCDFSLDGFGNEVVATVYDNPYFTEYTIMDAIYEKLNHIISECLDKDDYSCVGEKDTFVVYSDRNKRLTDEFGAYYYSPLSYRLDTKSKMDLRVGCLK